MTNTLEGFPPSSVNNSRSIVNNMIMKCKKYNEGLAKKIEGLTGWDVDYKTGADTGSAPERHNFD